MSINVTVSIGYQRRRPNYRGDRIEARLEGVGLMLAGAAVVLLALFLLIPKILSVL